MQPFDQYPGDGHKLLPRRKAVNTRREDGPELQRLTGQTACAYCGVCLTDNYHHWLLMTIDHVIPTSECQRLGIPDEWAESYSNMVLACSGCNGFDNRFQISWDESTENWTLARFFALRDRVFTERTDSIRKQREEEERFFRESILGT